MTHGLPEHSTAELLEKMEDRVPDWAKRDPF